MFITRRQTLTGFGASAFAVGGTSIRGVYADEKKTLKPGDYGYRHHLYHDEYQRLFSPGTRCPCGTGDCRVTISRKTELKSELGWDVMVDGIWRPLPLNVYMPPWNEISQAMREEPAHICAYGLGADVKIPCAILFDSRT
jgi:hypothetical protein